MESSESSSVRFLQENAGAWEMFYQMPCLSSSSKANTFIQCLYFSRVLESPSGGHTSGPRKNHVRFAQLRQEADLGCVIVTSDHSLGLNPAQLWPGSCTQFSSSHFLGFLCLQTYPLQGIRHSEPPSLCCMMFPE